MTQNAAKKMILASHIGDDLKNLCLQLADIVGTVSSSDGNFLTLKFFGERLDDVRVTDLVLGLSILSSIENPILETHAYIDGSDGPLILPDDEFRSFLHDGILVHPDFGEPLKHPENHIHLFYSIAQHS